MRILILFVAVLISTEIFAIGAPVGYRRKPGQPVTKQEREAVLALISDNRCLYSSLSGTFVGKEWEPEIYFFPDPCTKDPQAAAKKQVPMCVNTIACETPMLNFIIEKAICPAINGETCPSASECAQQSFFDSVVKNDEVFWHTRKVPIFQQKDQSKGNR